MSNRITFVETVNSDLKVKLDDHIASVGIIYATPGKVAYFQYQTHMSLTADDLHTIANKMENLNVRHSDQKT